MIETLNNLNRKSWDNYSGPESKFTEKNIIFGYNGKGKSSLAQGIYQTALDNGNPNERLRLFNNEYVKNELTLRNDQPGDKTTKIRGVIANFGKEAVETDEKVEELRKRLIDIEPLESNKDRLEKEIRLAIIHIHDNKKGSTNIQHKSGNVLEILGFYENDLKNALKIEPDNNKLIKIVGDDTLNKKLLSLENINIQKYNIPPNSTLDNVKNIFKRKTYDEIAIPSPDIIDWVTAGLELHHPGDKCHFCGGDVNYNEISKLVKRFNANEKQKDIKTLQNFNSKLTEIQNTTSDNEGQTEQLLIILDNAEQVEIQKKVIDSSKKTIALAKNIIRQKMQEIEATTLIYPNVSSALEQIDKANSKIIAIINTSIVQLREMITKKDLLVKGSIALDIKNNSILQNKVTEYKKLVEKIKKEIDNNNKIQEQIQKLLLNKSATSTFAIFINEILDELNINLKLSVSDDKKNYIITHSKDLSQKLNIEDISEGEKNILAILFFYYELFADNEQSKIKDGINLIIIDDPITSLDNSNSTYITSLVEQLLDCSNTQVFVLTHSWDFFSNVSYHHKQDPKYSYFEIKKDIDGKSFIVETKTNVTPYHHNFHEVYEFSRRPDVNKVNDCDIYHMPNIIRQVLEGFLSFKSKKSNPTKNNEAEIAKAIFNQEITKIGKNNRAKLTALLLLINASSHKSSRNPNEVWESAKFLMNKIKQADELHFNAHKDI